MEMNIQELSEIELKALAYDALANIEFYQGNLRALNGELARRKAMQEKEAAEVVAFPEPTAAEPTPNSAARGRKKV